MITIYLIRHGEVFNPKGKLYGRLAGFPLSDRGIISVRQAAAGLKDKNISHIYTSPMLRTQQTARIISKSLQAPIYISRLLIEVKIYCQGIPLDEYRVKIQEHLYSQENIKKGQETIESIYHRMMKFVHLCSERHPNENIVAVTHGDPILILKAKTTNKEFTWEYKRQHYTATGKWIKFTCKDNIFHWDE